MGLLTDIWKGKSETILSPSDGRLIPLAELQDSTYANGLLGEGMAIYIKSGTVAAPISGTVTLIMHTGHAICIRTDSGADVMIHVGLQANNTEIPYEVFVEEGQYVEAGDVILHVDYEALVTGGALPIIPVVISNPERFRITAVEEELVKMGDPILQIKSDGK